MSGIVNQTGARSGIVGTTQSVAATPSAVTLLYNRRESLSSGYTFAVGASARGTGTNAQGSGDLFQSDYSFYKVYLSGFGFSSTGYMGIKLIKQNGSLGSGSYRYANNGHKSNDSAADHGNQDGSFFRFTVRYDAGGNYDFAATPNPYGNTNMEITFFDPAGEGYTGAQWLHTQTLDEDQNLRQHFGGGSYKTAERMEGFQIEEVTNPPNSTFNSMISIAVYGFTSMA